MIITNKLELIVEAAQAPPTHAVRVDLAAGMDKIGLGWLHARSVGGTYHPACALQTDCIVEHLLGVPLWEVSLIKLPKAGAVCALCGLQILT